MIPVKGFEDYQVSDDGRVWSNRLYRGRRGRWLKPRLSGRGYLSVQLFRDGASTTRYVHHLVAEAFHGPRPVGLEVRHLNGDMRDNRASNLKWGTHVENMQDSVRHGTAKGWNAEKTHCPQGHPYLGDNLYINPQGRRECRSCGRARSLAYFRRKKLGEDQDRPTVK